MKTAAPKAPTEVNLLKEDGVMRTVSIFVLAFAEAVFGLAAYAAA